MDQKIVNHPKSPPADTGHVTRSCRKLPTMRCTRLTQDQQRSQAMSGNLEERLMQAKAQLRLKRKLEAMLGQAQKAVQEEQMKCSTLKELLAREKADVDKLEGLSLTGLFYSVMGTKGERIGKEQQEFLEAKLKHDEAQELLKDVQREVERLEDELTPLFDADAEYDRLLDVKEKVLAGAGDVSAKKLMEMSVQLADLSLSLIHI